LKGRPPGTPKSNDPNKKKRKRTARERDLCDVKIKITEYFPGAMLRPDFVPDGGQVQQSDPTQGNNFFAPGQPGAQPIHQQQQFGLPMVNNSLGANHPGATGQRYYTIQRVNGNGGNGKGDGIPGPHKHQLSESDGIKKNSVQRFLMKRDKEEKKTQVRQLKFLAFFGAPPPPHFRFRAAPEPIFLGECSAARGLATRNVKSGADLHRRHGILSLSFDIFTINYIIAGMKGYITPATSVTLQNIFQTSDSLTSVLNCQ
jgi:hypothetical protein